MNPDKIIELCDKKFKYHRTYNRVKCADPEVEEIMVGFDRFHGVCIDYDCHPTEFGKEMAEALRKKPPEELDKELGIWKAYIESLIGSDG